jgi:hypothetical protein
VAISRDCGARRLLTGRMPLCNMCENITWVLGKRRKLKHAQCLIGPHCRMPINMRVSFCVGVEHSPGFILVRIHEKNLTNLKAPPF